MIGILSMLNPKAKVLKGDKEAKTNDFNNNGREYTNKRRKVSPSVIQVGDTVILKQKKKNKFTTKFEPIPYTLLERKGVTTEAENQRYKMTRNVSLFKKITDVAKKSEDEDVWNAPRVDIRIKLAEREADEPTPEEPV